MTIYPTLLLFAIRAAYKVAKNSFSQYLSSEQELLQSIFIYSSIESFFLKSQFVCDPL